MSCVTEPEALISHRVILDPPRHVGDRSMKRNEQRRFLMGGRTWPTKKGGKPTGALFSQRSQCDDSSSDGFMPPR